jgi:hypothetical protein
MRFLGVFDGFGGAIHGFVWVCQCFGEVRNSVRASVGESTESSVNEL